MSYQPKVYRKQGGDQLIVASSGNVTVESGGGIDLSSGAQIRLADGAFLTVPVVTETTAAALSNYGVSIITKGTTATGANIYTMDAPVAGVVKQLVVLNANTSEHILVQGNTNVTYDGGAGSKDKLKIVAPGLITLVGVSTSAWSVVGLSTTVVSVNS